MVSCARKCYQWFSPLPPVLAAIVYGYVSRQEGWGAWSSASLMLPVVVLSFVVGVIGVLFTIHAQITGKQVLPVLLPTLLAASVALWFVARVVILELHRSF